MTLPIIVHSPAASSSQGFVLQDAGPEDIMPSAQIGTDVFYKASVDVFPTGRTQGQTDYRAYMYDGFFADSLAFKQGKRRLPLRYVVARDIASNRTVGFIIWNVQEASGGTQKPGDGNETPDGYKPQYPKPAPSEHYDESKMDKFWEVSAALEHEFIGNRTCCHIKYLAIEPSLQRSGLGKALVELARQDCSTLPTYLEAANTESAKHFWGKMGFKECGVLSFEGLQMPLACMLAEPADVPHATGLQL